jgi:hypothetical protein
VMGAWQDPDTVFVYTDPRIFSTYREPEPPVSPWDLLAQRRAPVRKQWRPLRLRPKHYLRRVSSGHRTRWRDTFTIRCRDWHHYSPVPTIHSFLPHERELQRVRRLYRSESEGAWVHHAEVTSALRRVDAHGNGSGNL